MSSVCYWLQNGSNRTTVNASLPHHQLALINRLTYAYISPCIIASGLFGDIMTVFILTHPLLRRSGIIYTYLTLLALTDLCTLISVIPMLLWLLDTKLCSYTAALYYAHVGFPLANALMGASVWIVVFLTLSQYMAVCHPFHFGGLRSRKMCYWLTALAYVINFAIYAPWGARKSVHRVPSSIDASCEYVACDRLGGTNAIPWFNVYQWSREAISRLIPFIFVAYLNMSILATYRLTKRDRFHRIANSQRRSVFEKSEREEKRLFLLLVGIVLIFFFCTIPAAPLTILVSDSWSQHLPFQIGRSIVNVMEFTKFALNFYFYCMINPDIRRICAHIIMCRKMTRPARLKGQPVNPVSLYTASRSTTARAAALPPDPGSSSSFHRKMVTIVNSSDKMVNNNTTTVVVNSTVECRTPHAISAGSIYDQLTVIRESDDSSNSNDSSSAHRHEPTSTL